MAEKIIEGSERERLGRMHIHEVVIEDPYVNEHFENISEQVAVLAGMGYYGDTTINLDRKRLATIDKKNPATAKLIQTLPTFENWLDTVPTAAALDLIYRPFARELPDGTKLHPDMNEWVRNLYDGIGIRSRAEVMKRIVTEEVFARPEKQQWLSLASGAAQPVFESLNRINEAGAQPPHVTLVDYDRKALDLARQYATYQSYADNVTTRRLNILSKKGLSHTRSESNFIANSINAGTKLPAAAYDIVDAVGILEYLKPDDWRYTYNQVLKTKRDMAGAVTFLKNSYDLVKPGGLLVTGNMRDTHPQLSFTLNVIQWPHIQPRSLTQMAGLFKQAGIDGEIDAYCPSDKVYAIYAIRKPGIDEMQ